MRDYPSVFLQGRLTVSWKIFRPAIVILSEIQLGNFLSREITWGEIDLQAKNLQRYSGWNPDVISG
ncbi:MAG: hypothetical protein DRI57_30540 [Deltaproteobacteria bacterium]|nr:MAG: hypothetical protein DRI57_30540 [Deltaproteobacteria bacterium]